jgi:hypothetical protein
VAFILFPTYNTEFYTANTYTLSILCQESLECISFKFLQFIYLFQALICSYWMQWESLNSRTRFKEYQQKRRKQFAAKLKFQQSTHVPPNIYMAGKTCKCLKNIALLTLTNTLQASQILYLRAYKQNHKEFFK